MKLVLATKNEKKLVEMRDILEELGFKPLLQSELGIDLEVEETGSSFMENALLKARAVMEASGLPALADDSGLLVDALGGEPGVYSARYGGKSTDRQRYELLLENMEGVADKDRGAGFRCAIACCFPDGGLVTAEADCRGEILRAPDGEGGFGYDPVFYIPELGRTMARLSSDEKNRISHRAKAIKIFAGKIKETIEGNNSAEQ